MNLRTELFIKPTGVPVQLNEPILLLGSCFSDNIGRKLDTFKFNVSVNPFGTLYNPYSIFNVIDKSIMKDWNLDEKKIVFNQGLYRYLDFHSTMASPSKEELIALSGNILKETGEFIRKAGWIIITFGTAIIYRYKETGEITANCHKLPSAMFSREWMSIDGILKEFGNLYPELNALNKNLNIMLTISPVRHLKEGFEANQLSKSILRIACEEITRKYGNAYYFPSYEIMMDDLRDYRFYNDDLVHPNNLAVEYLWEKFCNAWMDDETRLFLKEWNKILNAINHKPFHPDTDEHKQFVKQTVEKLNTFKNRVNVDAEINKLTGNV